MSDPASEPLFRLEIAGLPEPFVVVAFTGSEAISEPFVYEVELLIRDTTLDLASLLYRNAWLSLGETGVGIHGQINELVQQHHSAGCRMRIGPKLACLAQRFNQRVFNACSVPQIVRQVLKAHGITGRSLCFVLDGDYPSLDFCTQYRESDLHFVQRLCAQAGIHFHFEQSRDGHCLVFADHPGTFSTADPVVYRADGPSSAVRAFGVRTDASGVHVAQGRSDLRTLRCGQMLTLSPHPVEGWNQRWLVTSVEHRGQAGGYGNHFRAIPWGVPFVPAKVPAAPRRMSQQRGWVVAVNEPTVQMSGRIAVQFDWVYQGEGASLSHCWLPLAPELAASSRSALRDGTEVLVSFIEGDPDRPLISAFLDAPVQAVPEESSSSVTSSQLPGAAGADPVLLSAIQSAEPLVLLCLLPGGGCFSPCAHSVCACRMVTRRDAGATP
jgi:type VI secretion system secreted protein VgrG